MHLPLPNFAPQRNPEPPAMVRVVSRSDAMWDRPVFKAPPLVLEPGKFNPTNLAADLRRALRFDR